MTETDTLRDQFGEVFLINQIDLTDFDIILFIDISYINGKNKLT